LTYSEYTYIIIRRGWEELPNKTIYIREGDKELWEEAERLAGDSFSAFLTERVREYVEERKERVPGDSERIILELEDREGRPLKKAFRGRWLVSPNEELRTGDFVSDCYAVAISENDNFVVYTWNINGACPPRYEVFSSFEDMEEDDLPPDIVAAVAAELGLDYVEELDI